MEKWEAEGDPWSVLFIAAQRTVARTRSARVDVDQVAAEAVAQAWLRFREDIRPWHEVCAWVVVVAVRLARLSSGGRRGVIQLAEEASDELLLVRSEAPLWALIDDARAILAPVDFSVLTMLISGATLMQVATARGVSLRGVQRSVVRIRQSIGGGRE